MGIRWGGRATWLAPTICLLLAGTIAWAPSVAAAEPAASPAEAFTRDVRPLLVENCFMCHGDGESSGGIAFDQLEAGGKLLDSPDVWHRVLKNVRAGIMPPPDVAELSDADKATIEHWIKRQAFGLNPDRPDPGRVTLRRLNRTEYRNTIRDLIGVDYNTEEHFPPDDTGHGFDNMSDVLTVSPMLLEKYMAAAESIIGQAVPDVPLAVHERVIPGDQFEVVEGEKPDTSGGQMLLSFYEPTRAARGVEVEHAGTYKVTLHVQVNGRYVGDNADHNRAEFAFAIDGAERHRKDYGWQGRQDYFHEYELHWQPGRHELSVDIKPTVTHERQSGDTRMRVISVTVAGPLAEEYWVKPPGHERYFGAEPIPTDREGRRARAVSILRPFASRAFRRPADAKTVGRLVDLAEIIWSRPGGHFEAGISRAMVAVLASPRFLFLEESVQPSRDPNDPFPMLDEHSLASRMSYFLWSTMPDAELFDLAKRGELRKNLRAQVKRMLADPRAQQFYENFPGQWLQARDVEQTQVSPRRVLGRERYRELGFDDGGKWWNLRRAMRLETERYFAHVVREDRSALEFIDSNYTFLNERLAEHYGIEGVEGDEMRLVELPPDSPRGGVITQGTVLMATSNPTRTSVVKRGLFVLENILGTPPPPPPPDIPTLEDAEEQIEGREPTLREALELHRADFACMSCHNRMDPPGFALENFNALGMWRDTDGTEPVDASGSLVTGEEFKDVRELKKILVGTKRLDFYRCLTEKLMTYALGRGVEHHDVETVDQIVAALDRDGGRFSTLLTGIIESAPFQRRRPNDWDGGGGGDGSGGSSAVSSAAANRPPGANN